MIHETVPSRVQAAAMIKKIDQMRRSRQLTVQAFAKRAGLSEGACAAYLRGDRVPPADIFISLAAAVGYNIGMFIPTHEPTR